MSSQRLWRLVATSSTEYTVLLGGWGLTIVCSRARDAGLLEEVLQWHARKVVLVVKCVIKPCMSKTVTMRLDKIEGRYFAVTKTHFVRKYEDLAEL